jgi:FAD/FMN-containing dehydrogenase
VTAPSPSDLQAALQQVCATSSDLAGVEADWTRRVHGSALAVALPSSTDEVAGVLRVAREHGVRVTVRGGGTGLVAGAVPDGTLVLSTQRLDALGPVEHGTLVAGAGVTLAAVQARARRGGWDYGVDFAARDSCTIGGNVATNAGGMHVVAHGVTRAQVLGVEAVLADGSVVRRLAGLAKDATGYDLSQLLVGSEGTLGVITAVRVRLVPLPTAVETALVAVDSVEAAQALLARVRGLYAAELITAESLALVRRVCDLPAPFTDPAATGSTDAGASAPTGSTDAGASAPTGSTDAGASAPTYVVVQAPDLLAVLATAPEVRDATVAQDVADAERIWAYRERLTEAVSSVGVPHKLDVCLPVRTLPAFLAELPAAVRPHDAYVYGHLGDGNLHVNVLGPDPDDDAVDDAVLRLAAGHGGSIGAEHGIGRLKRQWLHLSRTPAELAAMRAVKTALDPDGLLNPGVLLP